MMSKITLPLGTSVEAWSGAIELHVNGESELRVDGPVDYRSWSDDGDDDDGVYIRLAVVGFEDDEHGDAGANVSFSLARDDAEQLAAVLGELAQADAEPFGEVFGDE